MDILLQDVRFAWRKILQRRAMTLSVVLCMGLGIGVNSAMFSVVNALLVRPLPFHAPDRLVVVYDTIRGDAGEVVEYQASPPNFVAWQEEEGLFDGIAAGIPWYAILTGGVEPMRVRHAIVSAEFFQVLGVEPFMGRSFVAEEDLPGAAADVAILSHDLWRSGFGADPNLVGKTVILNDESHTIVGITPPGFRFPLDEDDSEGSWVWTPLGLDSERTPQRFWHYLTVFARLAPEASLDQTQRRMETISARLEQEFPDLNTGWGTKLVPLREDLTGDIRPTLIFLLAAVGFVLLIACVNVASLMLAHAMERTGEFSIRLALGGSRSRLIRQLFTENLLLALLGGALGLALAYLGLPPLVALVPTKVFLYETISVDGTVLAFTFLISVLTGIFFGLAPAFKASDLGLITSLHQNSGRSTGSRLTRSLQKGLVVVELAIVLVLLIGAGLTLKSLHHLRQLDPGIRTEGVLTVATLFSAERYPEDHRRVSFLEQAIERITALPGVRSAAATTALPLGDAPIRFQFSIEGRLPDPSGELLATNHRLVSPGYFQTVGISLLEGRVFSERDHAEAPPVAVISQEMAQRFWPGESPLGKRVKRGEPEDEHPWMQIVGVVGDVPDSGLGDQPEVTWYLPYTQHSYPRYVIAVRSDNTTSTADGSSVREAIWSIDPDQPLYDLRTLDQLLSNSLAKPRFNTILLSLFAALGLALVAAGVYSVMAYFVRQRFHEIGVRIALGAQGREVLRLIFKQSALLALAGIVLGLLASFALTRIVESFLYTVSPTDPLIQVTTSTVLMTVALLATLVPAYRATQVDPIKTLRAE